MAAASRAVADAIFDFAGGSQAMKRHLSLSAASISCPLVPVSGERVRERGRALHYALPHGGEGTRQGKRSPRSGAAMVYALILLMVISMIGAALVRGVVAQHRQRLR